MDIKIKIEGINEVRRSIDPRRYTKIMTRTLNKVGAQGKTAISQQLRKTYNIKKDRIDKSFSIRKASNASLTYEMRIKGRSPGLQHYDARQARKGVTVKIIKASGRKVVKSGFMAKTPQGAMAVWRRVGAERMPIERLYGPSVVGMANKVGINSFQAVVNDKINKVFAHEFEWEMAR